MGALETEKTQGMFHLSDEQNSYLGYMSGMMNYTSYVGIMNHKPWVIRIPSSKDEYFMEGMRGIFSWLTWKGSWGTP